MIKPLEYNSGLSLKEAYQRYREVRDGFERVKKHYCGLFGRFKRNMSENYKKTLADYVCAFLPLSFVLLPLSLEASVQRELLEAKPKEKTLWYKIGLLQSKIMAYEANFLRSDS